MGRVYRLAVLIDNNVLDLIDAVSSPYLDEEDLPRDLRDLSESSYEFVQEVREKADSPGQTNGEYRALVRDFEDARDELRDLRLGWRTDRILDRLSRLIAELGFYYGDRISPPPHDRPDRPDRPDWDDDRSPDGVIESARRIERLTRLAYLQAYQEMQRGRPISSDAEELVEALLNLREAGRDFYAEVRSNRGNLASSMDEFNDVVRYHALALRRADRSNSSLRGTLQSIGHEIDELRRLDRGRGDDRRGDDPYDRPGYIPIDRMPWAEPRTSPRSDFDDRRGDDDGRDGDDDGRDENERRSDEDDDLRSDDDDRDDTDRIDDDGPGWERYESRDDPRPTIRLQRSN